MNKSKIRYFALVFLSVVNIELIAGQRIPHFTFFNDEILENGHTIVPTDEIRSYHPYTVVELTKDGDILNVSIEAPFPYEIAECRVALITPPQINISAKELSFTVVNALSVSGYYFLTEDVTYGNGLQIYQETVESIIESSEFLLYRIAPSAIVCLGGPLFWPPLAFACPYVVQHYDEIGQVIENSIATYHAIQDESQVAQYLCDNDFVMHQIEVYKYSGKPVIKHLLEIALPSDLFSADIAIDADLRLNQAYVDRNHQATQMYYSMGNSFDVLPVIDQLTIEPYAGGSGTQTDPYQISRSADWQQLTNTPTDWDKHFVLTEDLDLSATISLSPVGNDLSNFTGFFEGNGHVIRNAVLNEAAPWNVGLFGKLGVSGEIRNLGAEEVSITGGQYCVGGLVGQSNGRVISCYATGQVASPEGDCVGGLVGSNFDGRVEDSRFDGTVEGRYVVGGLVGDTVRLDPDGGTVVNCSSAGSVVGIEQVGGIAGANVEGTVSKCDSSCSVVGGNGIGGLVGVNFEESIISSSYATGDVIADVNFVGGLVGFTSSGAEIADSYSTGSVTGGDYVGGLAGEVLGSAITNCYSCGPATGSGYVGGLIGHNEEGVITESFWGVESSGVSISPFGGTGQSTGDMRSSSTFVEAGWDFVGETVNGTEDIWSICEGTNFPRLTWQIPVADWICPNGVGMEDFSYFGAAWATTGNGDSPANLNGEEGVNFDDLKVFVNMWLDGK
ncbi:MAG: hypothetical protein ISS79_05630 [Phycisphaerae bacterium]|nr:hypothetical protein [Phycisphaerae bacterium]